MTETPALPDFTGYAPVYAVTIQEGDDLLVHDTHNSTWTLITPMEVRRTGHAANPEVVRFSNDRVGFNISRGEDSPLRVFRKAKPLPAGIGAVVEFEAGGKSWRLVHTDAQNWTLLREFKSGYAFNTWVNNEGAAERLAEATEVRIVNEGVVL